MSCLPCWKKFAGCWGYRDMKEVKTITFYPWLHLGKLKAVEHLLVWGIGKHPHALRLYNCRYLSPICCLVEDWSSGAEDNLNPSPSCYFPSSLSSLALVVEECFLLQNRILMLELVGGVLHFEISIVRLSWPSRREELFCHLFLELSWFAVREESNGSKVGFFQLVDEEFTKRHAGDSDHGES